MEIKTFERVVACSREKNLKEYKISQERFLRWLEDARKNRRFHIMRHVAQFEDRIVENFDSPVLCAVYSVDVLFEDCDVPKGKL